jgi:D-beta-D-heptose 7-phosphate kinase/D-beta-D-heptose 1-phosphate adenosyltransferase
MGVVGDLMLDRYLWGTASRLSPEAAVPVIDFAGQDEFPGGAGNVIANLVSLGARVTPFGVTGEDEAGAVLRQCLRKLGLAHNGVVADASRPTTVKTRIMTRHQQVVRVDRETRAPLAKPVEEQLIRRIKSALPKLDVLIISDYAKGVVTPALSERVLESCHKLGVRVFVQPKTPILFTARGAAAVVCNLAEAATFVRHLVTEDEESLTQTGKALLAHFGSSSVVITRGAKGMNVFEEAQPRSFHVPAISREVTYARVGLPGIEQGETGRQVFDVTGAGDTVMATLALAVAAGASLREAAILANAAAGVVVGKLGTATVRPLELLATLKETF